MQIKDDAIATIAIIARNLLYVKKRYSFLKMFFIYVLMRLMAVAPVACAAFYAGSVDKSAPLLFNRI